MALAEMACVALLLPGQSKIFLSTLCGHLVASSRCLVWLGGFSWLLQAEVPKKKPKQPVQNGGPLGLSQAVPVQIDTANEGVLAVDVSVCGAKLVRGKDLKVFECEGCRFFKKEPIAEVDHWIQRTEVCRLLQPNEMRTRKK